jgi:hypothetical protein
LQTRAIIPLACGGADLSSNMRRQTVPEAKLKDKTEIRPYAIDENPRSRSSATDF